MMLSRRQSHCDVGQRQAAADPQTKATDLGCESACRLLSSTLTIVIYYYSVRKLILILPSRELLVEGWMDLGTAVKVCCRCLGDRQTDGQTPASFYNALLCRPGHNNTSVVLMSKGDKVWKSSSWKPASQSSTLLDGFDAGQYDLRLAVRSDIAQGPTSTGPILLVSIWYRTRCHQHWTHPAGLYQHRPHQTTR